MLSCLHILDRFSLIEKIEVDDHGNVKKFQSNLDYFNPVSHIFPTNPTDGMNISPMKSYKFSVFRSIQNIKVLKG